MDKETNKKYLQKKSLLRQEAIDFQNNFSNKDYSYGEIMENSNYFEKYGKKYGLIKEFRENCII